MTVYKLYEPPPKEEAGYGIQWRHKCKENWEQHSLTCSLLTVKFYAVKKENVLSQFDLVVW